jgi:uncharacterized protein (DUF302 family)
MKYSKTLGSVVLSTLLLLGTTGCDSSDDPAAAAEEEVITPYTRVAVIEGKDWDDVNDIATKIAQYVIHTDESDIAANGVMELPTNWVIAGAKLPAETFELGDLLPIPVLVNGVTKKSRVVEFCNGAYATKAVGTGKFHGSALPCEVSVHSENGNVYVDMLDAEAIFNIFFTDAKENFTAEENAEFAQMASDVKSELRQMIIAALADPATGVTKTDPIVNTELTDELGPEFTQDKIDNDIAFRSPYIVYKYKRTDGDATFDLADAGTLAQGIIDVLGEDGDTAENRLPGLSIGSAWRSGRPDPIAIPGVKVVEACSPKYAKKATALGNEYITALPCEFTVYVDETDPTGETLAISFLNPNFMFGTMFEGAVSSAFANDDLTKADVIEYSTLADVVFGDLRMIVDHAVQSSSMKLKIK